MKQKCEILSKRELRSRIHCRTRHRAECGNTFPEVISHNPVLLKEHTDAEREAETSSGRLKSGKLLRKLGETMVVLRNHQPRTR